MKIQLWQQYLRNPSFNLWFLHLFFLVAPSSFSLCLETLCTPLQSATLFIFENQSTSRSQVPFFYTVSSSTLKFRSVSFQGNLSLLKIMTAFFCLHFLCRELKLSSRDDKSLQTAERSSQSSYLSQGFLTSHMCITVSLAAFNVSEPGPWFPDTLKGAGSSLMFLNECLHWSFMPSAVRRVYLKAIWPLRP